MADPTPSPQSIPLQSIPLQSVTPGMLEFALRLAAKQLGPQLQGGGSWKNSLATGGDRLTPPMMASRPNPLEALPSHSLMPVDHDPFAYSATPVDHDPFATEGEGK